MVFMKNQNYSFHYWQTDRLIITRSHDLKKQNKKVSKKKKQYWN